jgi:DNA-binding MarR family transcriptional regulator
MPAHLPNQSAALMQRLTRLLRDAEHETGLNSAEWEALRYLARCNRFSNTPPTVAEYLARTAGAVSLAIITLEAKGLIEKQRVGDGSRIELTVTPRGRAVLGEDPWEALASEIDDLPESLKERLEDALQHVLLAALAPRGLKTFGLCATCRHFRPRGAVGRSGGPHLCGLLQLPLSSDDTKRICAEHSVMAA